MAKKTKALKSLAQIGAGLGTAYLLSRMEEPKAKKNTAAEIAQDTARVNQYTQTRKRSDNVAENFDSFIPRLAIMAEGGEVEIGKGKDYIKDLL